MIKGWDALEKIGEGKCANAYRDGRRVYKILKQGSDSRMFYSREKLEQLVGIKSNLCVFPDEILESENGDLLGYSMDFVEGQKLYGVIRNISFEELQTVMTQAENGIEEVSEQGIIFLDLHSDNLMWDEENRSIKIIDTDFFGKTENTSNLRNTNSEIFNFTLQNMIYSIVSQYGIRENEQFVPFYNLGTFAFKNGERVVSTGEYVLNLKEIMEREFSREFNNLAEIEQALQEKEEILETQQKIENVPNKLTIKEKILQFLAQNRFLRKLPFIDKLIKGQIKMLPPTTSEQKSSNTMKNRFVESLRNYETPPIVPSKSEGVETVQKATNKISDEIEL